MIHQFTQNIQPINKLLVFSAAAASASAAAASASSASAAGAGSNSAANAAAVAAAAASSNASRQDAEMGVIGKLKYQLFYIIICLPGFNIFILIAR